MRTSDDVALELRNIDKVFRRPGTEPTLALSQVNLAVNVCETVALVGESGSGKSTAARIALGLLKPDGGEVMLQGERIDRMATGQMRLRRRTIQPVFQDSSTAFNPRKTVANAFKPCFVGLDPPARIARTEGALEDVGLSPAPRFLDRYPHELSGGQRQRLAIARALAVGADVLIMDEPLSGADVSIRAQLLNLLERVQREHSVSILLITHDLSVAEAVADRVYVIHRGNIVESGPATEVISSPQDPYTKRLLASVPVY